MLRKSTNDLSIRPKMSTTTLMALIVGGVFAANVALYLAYSKGVEMGNARLIEDAQSIERLNQAIMDLKEEIEVAKQGLTFSQRQQQIQEEAYSQMSKAYSNSEQKNRVLGSRLDFYRSIISPQDGQSGPAIQDLAPSYDAGVLSFDITLVQAIKHKHQVRGSLKIVLYENDIATGQWPASSSRSVNYQYFEQISGSIERPNLNQNAKLYVELQVQGGESLERWFELADIVQENMAKT